MKPISHKILPIVDSMLVIFQETLQRYYVIIDGFHENILLQQRETEPNKCTIDMEAIMEA